MVFERDSRKEAANVQQHGVRFTEALSAFEDPNCVVQLDVVHSTGTELRWWLLGLINGRVMTVRYTHRPGGTVRIIGAGWWRQGKKLYEEANLEV